MFKVSIQPDWQLQTQDGDAVARRLIDLLVGIHESGSLAGACARSDVSYRYAWGILQRGQKIFGSLSRRWAIAEGLLRDEEPLTRICAEKRGLERIKTKALSA